jgi:AraC-like DNA-binding protein
MSTRAASGKRSRSSCTCRCSSSPGADRRRRSARRCASASSNTWRAGSPTRSFACTRSRSRSTAAGAEPEGVAGFILQQRLQACRRALAEPSAAQRTVTDIAMSKGFNNLAHFSRVFKARDGTSPSEYRASMGTRLLDEVA